MRFPPFFQHPPMQNTATSNGHLWEMKHPTLAQVDDAWIDTLLNRPDVKAMIDKINALGEEIKELRKLCEQLKEQKDGTIN